MASSGKVKICLLGATFATNNMGVGALTAGAIETVLHTFPDAEIWLLDYGIKHTVYRHFSNGRTIPVELINLRFSKKIFLKNNVAFLLFIALLIRLIPFKKLRARAYLLNPYLKRINEAVIFAAISGGDSFSDIYGMGRLMYVSLPQFLALLMQKELVILPQTIGPFKSRMAKSVAGFILGRAKAIYSRDREALKEIGLLSQGGRLAGKLRFSYDLGFVLAPVKPGKFIMNGNVMLRRADRPVVGVNISGLLLMGGYTRDNMFGLKSDYRELSNEIIRLIMDKGACVLLVPHVFGADGESDMTACEKIYAGLEPVYGSRIAIVRGEYNPGEIKYVIGQCDFFIGARMHACIAALSQNIPAVSIAYSRKFRGVLQTIGMDALVADPRTMDKEEILRIVSGSFENRRVLSEQLALKMPEVKKTVCSMMGDIYTQPLDGKALGDAGSSDH
ncbi:MAG: polysaccharide pyruvyl transferase family protein [Nitrospiraceae bacterium]|nr:polysaccharide pyruvyl transferase family protein [Nitrospiraceae bacterium]